MNCATCNKPLQPWEIAQPMTILGRNVRPASLCDTCAHNHTTPPSSAAAMERLITGKTDPDEATRLKAVTDT